MNKGRPADPVTKGPHFSARTGWDREENPLARELAKARAAGREIVDLSESNPTRVGLGGGIELVASLGDPGGALYAPTPAGSAAAREAVSRYYADKGASVDPARVVLSASTSESYSWVFKLLCDRGDRVLVPTPSYPLLGFLADLEDVTLVPYPLDPALGFRLDVDALERAIDDRTRAVVVIHPNNPTGSFVTRADAERLFALCAEHGLALVSDEVFGDYALRPPSADVAPTFANDPPVLTFVLSGLSKVVALPQVKVGWLVAGGPAVAEALARLELVADTFLSVNTPAANALGTLLGGRGHVQQRILERVRANLVSLDRALAGRAARRLPFDAGWSAIVASDGLDDEGLVLDLLREDAVVVHPGFLFDLPEALVVSLLPEPDRFSAAIARLALRLG